MFKLILSIRFYLSLVMLLSFHLMGYTLFRNLSLALVSIVVLYNKDILNKVKSLLRNKTFWVLLLPFFCYAFSLLYTTDFLVGWKSLETKMSLLLFPVLFSLAKLKRNEFYLFLKTAVLIISVLPLIGFVNQFFLFQELGDTGLFYNDNLVSIFNKQAVYYAFYCNTALLLLIYLVEKNQLKSALSKVSGGIVFFLLIGAQYLLASRTSMMVMVGILAAYLIWLVSKRLSRIQGVAAILGAVVLVIAMVSAFPKVLKRFESITNIAYHYDNPNPINHFNGEIKKENWNGLNTRLALWSCAIEKIKEAPFLGYGIGDVQSELVEKYEEKNFILALKSNYNTHNQYLDILMTSGIFGLILFFVFLSYMVMIAFKSRNWLLLGFIVLFTISSVTENMLNRNQGVVFIALFISLLCFNRKLTNC